MVNAECADVIKITILPCTGIYVKPNVYCIALMDIELRYFVSTENPEQAGARILVFCLDYKLLRFPRVASAF